MSPVLSHSLLWRTCCYFFYIVPSTSQRKKKKHASPFFDMCGMPSEKPPLGQPGSMQLACPIKLIDRPPTPSLRHEPHGEVISSGLLHNSFHDPHEGGGYHHHSRRNSSPAKLSSRTTPEVPPESGGEFTGSSSTRGDSAHRRTPTIRWAKSLSDSGGNADPETQVDRFLPLASPRQSPHCH